MFKIVKCPCGEQEYYGMMHWRNGKQMCRKCIYTVWSNETGWVQGKTDYVFPLYEGGVDKRMNTYYVSLVRGLLGYYVKIQALSENELRSYLQDFFPRMWCNIYRTEDMPRLHEKYGVKVINEDEPIKVW